MSRRVNKIKKENDSATSREDLLIDEFLNLAINRFTWDNLPLGLSTERLEEMLILHGTLGAFKNEVDLLTILPIYQNNKLNIYGEYDSYRIKGFNGSEYEKTIDEIVKLKNNPLGTEDFSTLLLYANRIDEIERTQEVNLFQQCIPKIMFGDHDSVLTMKNIIKKIKDFKFVILAKDKGIKKSALKSDDVIDTTAPYLLDKLSDYENFYRSKVLTFLGINNGNTDKKERLIVDEINVNNDYININLDLMFDMRKKFCKEVNEKFDFNISVRKREVEQNGTVYNDITGSDGDN